MDYIDKNGIAYHQIRYFKEEGEKITFSFFGRDDSKHIEGKNVIQEFQETMGAYNYVCMYEVTKAGSFNLATCFDENKMKTSLQILEKNMYKPKTPE